jgi:fucose 4-O-acetylase-like acetyltransferase
MTKPRVEMVDAVKGIAIVLVVYGHVAQGLIHRGWWTTPLAGFQDKYIYSFHMAAFFFVSGLFLKRSLSRTAPRNFILQRVRTILWPYLFSAANVVLEVQLHSPGKLHERQGILHSVAFPFLSGSASWFLPTLFLCLLLAVLLNRMPDWARITAALALSCLWPADGLGTIVSSVAKYFVFVAIGEWVGLRIERAGTIPRWAGFAGAILAFLLLGLRTASGVPQTKPEVILLGFCGTLGLFLLASAFRNSMIETAFSWIGEASLGIFVLHPYFQGALHFVLPRLMPSHPVPPDLAIVTTAAVLMPAVLWHFRKQLHLNFLFECPWGAPVKTGREKQVLQAQATTAALS